MSNAGALAAPFVSVPAADAPRPQRPPNAVARWKRQLSWFAGIVATLMVLVAATCAVLVWHVIGEVARAERANEERSRSAVDARLAVLDVERLLSQTLVESDPAKVRAAAVSSIASASRLEDAVTALRVALPASPEAREMRALVEQIKAPRVRMIILARKGDREGALAAREGIVEPLKQIDRLSGAILEQQVEARQRAGAERSALFGRMLQGLVAAATLGALVAGLFYRRLRARFVPVEQLLEEVAHTAGELEAGGRELDAVNSDVQRANQRLRVLLEGCQEAMESMIEEAQRCLQDVDQLSQTCQESAAMSRRHAEDSGVVASQIQATTARLHELLQATGELGRSRSDIARFADEIQHISATTRLLSLNAAVEAARAGAAGRGFSVIASSVRKLSEDTQQAAQQIRRASEDITRQLGATTNAVQETSTLMDDGAGRISALDGSARSNQSLADGMHGEVQGIRGSFQRQVERIRRVDRESQALAAALEDGTRHARVLDATSAALAQSSSALMQRLSSLQA